MLTSEIAYLRKIAKDKYGQIKSESDIPFDCIIERETQYEYRGAESYPMGKGLISTEETSLTVAIGDIIVIDCVEFTVSKFSDFRNDMLAHLEIIYV